MRIGVVILAAGEGKRIGVPKALLRWGAETFLQRALRAYAGCDPVVVVLGARFTEAKALLPAPAEAVFNANFRGPMLSSVQRGLEALPAGVDAAFLAPVDQPLADGSLVQALRAAFEGGRAACTLPQFEGRPGHPLLVRADVFPHIARLAEHQTLQDFVAGLDADDVQRIDTSLPEAVLNINTPEDYRAFMTRIMPT